MSSEIRNGMASTPEMLAAFGDEALIAHALAFEAALARAQAVENVISPAAADAIAAACASLHPSAADLAEAAAHAGTLAIPLVQQLRARTAEADPDAAKLVHLGATSQDLADTALMLQAKVGAGLIDRDLARLAAALAALAQAHAATPMLARTLMQAALATTFGLRAVQWMSGVDAALARFRREARAAIVLQLGGPAGTLGGLQGRGEPIARRMAAELGLASPPLPWHARRDALAGLAASLAIVAGATAKIARDVALMAQTEVAEAFEPQVPGRGGSSAMAHKRNPTGCQVALSAGLRAPGLAAAILAGLPQEQERGLGGWQAEAPVLAELFEIVHGGLAAMVVVIEGLDVDAAAMARNLAAADVGGDTGEAEVMVGRALAARQTEEKD